MRAAEILQDHLQLICPEIHSTRLQALFDVSTALQNSQNLSLTEIARSLDAKTTIKHRVKKVDQLLSNQHLYEELETVYRGLSDYIFKYINQDNQVPIVVDLCFMKDSQDIQMLSAKVASKGRTIPVHREVFEINQLKNRSKQFISHLSSCLPKDRAILIIMDAGFGEEWFSEIEEKNWYWLV